MPNVLSPRDLVFRPDIMDETAPHTYMVKKPLKIFFSGTGGSISTKLGMKLWGLQPIIVYTNDNPGLPLT